VASDTSDPPPRQVGGVQWLDHDAFISELDTYLDQAGRRRLDTGHSSMAAMTIFAVVGVGVGSLIRNQTAAVVVALIWLLVVDNLLVSFAHDIGKWTPLGATAALAGASNHGLLPMWAGAALFVAYGLAFAVGGTRFTMRRDVS
jgi:hypothetical protein